MFGWEDKTNIDLPNENKGFIPSAEWKKETKNEGWWDGDSYNLSIGQGDLKVTPIEDTMAYVALVNGGTRYKPQLVKKVIDENKKDVKVFEPETVGKIEISPENLQIAKEGMRLAVTGEGISHASSIILNSLSVKAAAKTGTAETSILKHYHNWITVFAPYDNPKIVLTILLENAPTQAATLVPARNILEWYFSKDNEKN